MVADRCGPDVPLACDFLAQNCGAAGYGCYGVEPSLCIPAGTIPVDQSCQLAAPGECVPGADCHPNLDGTGIFTCQPYCDPVSTTAANACAKLCPNAFGEIYGTVSMERIGAFCSPATFR